MPKDILLNEFSGEVLFADGDFTVGESTRQHQKGLLLAEKGELREAPTRGVGLGSWLNDEQAGNLNGAVKREFELDGMNVVQVSGKAEKLQIEASYATDSDS